MKVFGKGKTYDAQGNFDGKTLTVLKGSKISCKTLYGTKRDDLIKKVCTKKGNTFLLEKDVLFQSLTAAANFCTGRSVNGWSFWKDSSKKPLNTIVEHKYVKRPRRKKSHLT